MVFDCRRWWMMVESEYRCEDVLMVLSYVT